MCRTTVLGPTTRSAVIDLVEQKPLPQIDLGPLRGPHGLAFAGGKVWFTAEVAKAIGSYDPAAAKLDWILGTGQNRTHMIFVSEDLKRIITTNTVSGTVSIIEKSAARAPGPPPACRPARIILPAPRAVALPEVIGRRRSCVSETAQRDSTCPPTAARSG